VPVYEVKGRKVVRVPRPSNKPEKEKGNGKESKEGWEEGSEETDGEVIPPGEGILVRRFDPVEAPLFSGQ
jgi:hypothetical protein